MAVLRAVGGGERRRRARGADGDKEEGEALPARRDDGDGVMEETGEGFKINLTIKLTESGPYVPVGAHL